MSPQGLSSQEYAAVFDERLRSLDRDVEDLSRSFSARFDIVSNEIKALSAKFDERSKIQWPAVGAVITAISLIGAVVWYPISNEQRRTEVQISAIIAQAEKDRDAMRATFDRGRERIQQDYVSQREIDARLVSAAQRRDDVQRLTDQRLASLDSKLTAIETALVPRGEHEEKWRSQGVKDTDLQRQLDAIKTQFGDLYSPKDALQNLYRRIEDLERRLLTGRTATSS